MRPAPADGGTTRCRAHARSCRPPRFTPRPDPHRTRKRPIFNGWSTASAALLPAIPAGYAFTRATNAPQTTVWTGAGAALAILAALLLMKIRPPSEPTERRIATAHALALMAGSLVLVLVNRTLGFPHGIWAVTAFCLVFLPTSGETRTQASSRVLATIAGALAATALAVVLPGIICLALAAGCALFTVAYALTRERDAQFMQIAFLTATVLLLYGAGKTRTTLSLSGERILMTLMAGILAIFMTILLTISLSYRERLHERVSEGTRRIRPGTNPPGPRPERRQRP